MTQDEYEEFRHTAVHELMDLSAEVEQKFNISKWERWFYDSKPGTITFSENGITKVIASVQVVGTTSAKTNSRMWAWANESVPPSQTARLAEVQAFGEAEALPVLTEEYGPDDEYHDWEMTAITAKIIRAIGAYRIPRDGGGYKYFVFTGLRFADEAIE